MCFYSDRIGKMSIVFFVFVFVLLVVVLVVVHGVVFVRLFYIHYIHFPEHIRVNLFHIILCCFINYNFKEVMLFITT